MTTRWCARHPLASRRDARRPGGSEAASGEEALQLAERERPDVILMDIAMKGITGLEAAAGLRERQPEVRVVILSMHSGEEYVRRRCARRCRLPPQGRRHRRARACAAQRDARESWLSPAVSRQVVAGYAQHLGGEVGPDVLTARQREVLKLVAAGRARRRSPFCSTSR